MEEWISGRLPLCKVGRGPNDWDEESVSIILTWLRATFGPEKTRGDAIAYITKRNHPDRDEYPALLARLDEGFAAKAKKAQAAQPIVAAALPDAAPPPAEAIAELRRRLGGAA